MLRQISTKSHAQAQRSPQHERVFYILGPKSPYIEILENRACTMNFQKQYFTNVAAQSAHSEQY